MQAVSKPLIMSVVALGALWLLSVEGRRRPMIAQSPAAKAGATAVASNSAAGAMEPYSETIPGTNVTFQMIPIQGGTFTMGSPSSESGRSEDEGPQHQVQINPFWVEVYETTWDEYDIFAFSSDLLKRPSGGQKSESDKLADAVTRPTPPYSDETFGFGRDHHPAIDMTHHAAMEYTRWLSAKTGKEYRLPTEAEWEYACRAGTETTFYFGSDRKQLGDFSWYIDNWNAQRHKGGKKKRNAWGLYDMLGNVAEWCLDQYDKNAYQPRAGTTSSIALISPVVLPTEKKYPNVARGGSWDDDPDRLRCAARLASDPDWSQQDPQRPQSIWWHTDATFLGFRVVRPLEEQDNLKGLRSKVKKYD